MCRIGSSTGIATLASFDDDRDPGVVAAHGPPVLFADVVVDGVKQSAAYLQTGQRAAQTVIRFRAPGRGARLRSALVQLIGVRCDVHRMKNAALPHALSLGDRIVAASDEPGNNAAYEEYLRGFDDIPVLQDAVRIPPRRQLPPDFRRGERRDVRQEQRPDAYSVREATMAQLVLLYREYSQPAPAPVVRAKPKKKQKRKSKKSNSKKRSRA